MVAKLLALGNEFTRAGLGPLKTRVFLLLLLLLLFYFLFVCFFVCLFVLFFFHLYSGFAYPPQRASWKFC